MQARDRAICGRTHRRSNGVVGYHVGLTRSRSSVRSWVRSHFLLLFKALGVFSAIRTKLWPFVLPRPNNLYHWAWVPVSQGLVRPSSGLRMLIHHIATLRRVNTTSRIRRLHQRQLNYDRRTFKVPRNKVPLPIKTPISKLSCTALAEPWSNSCGPDRPGECGRNGRCSFLPPLDNQFQFLSGRGEYPGADRCASLAAGVAAG